MSPPEIGHNGCKGKPIDQKEYGTFCTPPNSSSDYLADLFARAHCDEVFIVVLPVPFVGAVFGSCYQYYERTQKVSTYFNSTKRNRLNEK